MSEWNHPICDVCWSKRELARIPLRLSPKRAELEYCCFCNDETKGGIYIRQDVAMVPRHITHNSDKGNSDSDD